MGAMLFAVLAVAAQSDREYIREKTLEGHRAAAAKGNHSGRPRVIDDDMLTFALALRAKGTPVPGWSRLSGRRAAAPQGAAPQRHRASQRHATSAADHD